MKTIEVNISQQLPETAGEGIGNGAQALGEGAGKGIQSVGQGLGYLFACLGDRIKYGKCPISTNLLAHPNNTLLSVAQNYSIEQDRPTTLLGAINYQEENNLRQFVKNIVEDLCRREESGEELPKQIKDTDNILAIEKCASETNDDDFSKLWARIFVEESCYPDTFDKVALEIVKKLDKDTAILMQNKIFPYCTKDGWFLHENNEYLGERIIAEDYDLIKNYSIKNIPVPLYRLNNVEICCVKKEYGNYQIIGHPGYDFNAPYRLTKAGRAIKKALNMTEDVDKISEIGDIIKKRNFFSKNSQFKSEEKINDDERFIIADCDGKVIYGKEKYLTINDFIKDRYTKVSPLDENN